MKKVLVIGRLNMDYSIRTSKIPFVQSHASGMVYGSSILISLIAILVPYTWLGRFIGLVALPLPYLSIILIVPILYCIVALFAKKFYIKKFGEWI